MGVGSTGAAATIEGRKFCGIEKDTNYFSIASERIRKAVNGELKYRSFDNLFMNQQEN